MLCAQKLVLFSQRNLLYKWNFFLKFTSLLRLHHVIRSFKQRVSTRMMIQESMCVSQLGYMCPLIGHRFRSNKTTSYLVNGKNLQDEKESQKALSRAKRTSAVRRLQGKVHSVLALACGVLPSTGFFRN